MAAAPLALLGAGAALTGRAGPPYSPEDALRTFQLEPGFRIELVAAEPLVSDPVAMEVDEAGRLYVVEMHGYPLDLGNTGRVVLLHDRDADGRADARTVFAEGLRLPTGIMRWKQGVLVTDPPEVLYLEDADGDGRAEIRRTLLTGFALSNPQHIVNSPLYGPDNWVYLANQRATRTIRYQDLLGDQGEPVRFADGSGPTLPRNAGGVNVRFRPDSRELEMLATESQFGQAFDPWGSHFLVTNSRHLYQERVAARYLNRNPSLPVAGVTESLPDYGSPARVYPVTDEPGHQMLTDVGVMTSAGGLVWYGDDLFPPPFRGTAFVTESAHNLVHVAALLERGSGWSASRMREGREFLASTDAWFRPVNQYVGPDGALYVIDYYRGIIEHPEWLDDETAASDRLYAGRDRGRIYRIVPTGAPRADWIDRLALDRAGADELVAALERPRAWWRRTAQRLLVDRRPADAPAALARLAAEGRSAEARVHALWTLEGIGALRSAQIARALVDPAAGVREAAIRLAEPRLAADPGLAARLLERAGEPHPRVRLHLLFALGEMDTPAARDLRHRLLLEGVEDPWMQVAALSARGEDGARLLDRAARELSGAETAGRRALFGRLGALAGAAADPAATRRVIALAAVDGEGDWWRSAALQGLAGSIPAARRRDPALEPERAALAGLVLRGGPGALRTAAVTLLESLGPPAGSLRAELARFAADRLGDPVADPALRADAVRLLAIDGSASHGPALREAMGAGRPPAVQVAALRALGSLPDAEVGPLVLSLYPRWTPMVRAEALTTLARDPGRAALLVAALEQGRVNPGELEVPVRNRLIMADDPALRARARALFTAERGAASAAAERALRRYRPALDRPGSAARGAPVFARACASCHQYGGRDGARFGPDLGEVRGQRPAALLTSILHPDRSIVDGYELWTLERTDGTALSGVMAGETPAAVTLRQPGGREVTVARAEIAALQMSDRSAMPAGLEAAITPAEMADLIAYLRGGALR